jgi:hypothetical protein
MKIAKEIMVHEIFLHGHETKKSHFGHTHSKHNESYN